ncbi:Cupredoxin [Ramicandelaber brevisporus]|nr:Cupredoxin [Ramicandelaber brevisporus]
MPSKAQSLLLFAFAAAVVPAVIARTVTVTGTPGSTFEPKEVRIQPGDSVKWIMKGPIPHDVVEGSGCEEKDGGFRSPLINGGKEYVKTFGDSGRYEYFCTPHCDSGMTGTVIVE